MIKTKVGKVTIIGRTKNKKPEHIYFVHITGIRIKDNGKKENKIKRTRTPSHLRKKTKEVTKNR